MLQPAFLVGLLLLAGVLHLCYALRRRREFPLNKYIRTFTSLMVRSLHFTSRLAELRPMSHLQIFSYTVVTNASFNFRSCIAIGDNLLVVRDSPAIDCTTDKYQAWSVLVLFSIIFYSILGPLVLLAVLCYKQRKGRLYPDAVPPQVSGLWSWLRRWLPNSDNAKLDEEFQARYGGLAEAYRPRVYFYEVIAIMRRTALVALSVTFYGEPATRAAALALLCLAALGMHIIWRPFRQPADNRLELYTLTLLAVLAVLIAPYHSSTGHPPTVTVAFLLLFVLPTLLLATVIARETLRKARTKLSGLVSGIKRGRKKSGSHAAQADAAAAVGGGSADKGHDAGAEMHLLADYDGKEAVVDEDAGNEPAEL